LVFTARCTQCIRFAQFGTGSQHVSAATVTNATITLFKRQEGVIRTCTHLIDEALFHLLWHPIIVELFTGPKHLKAAPIPNLTEGCETDLRSFNDAAISNALSDLSALQLSTQTVGLLKTADLRENIILTCGSTILWVLIAACESIAPPLTIGVNGIRNAVLQHLASHVIIDFNETLF